MSALVETSYSIGMVAYEIRGTEEEVAAEIASTIERYNPRGYGTYFEAPRQVSKTEWKATGSRYSSCD